ncbi:MAG: Gfo/Idh/MocA family protein [Christensenellales bacterium]|jgi:1,5-anhydro-D-fructose reductase (1,5-anhydro-D-mannitol-forming)
MVNILMLSKWHVHAKDYARQIQEQKDARITCVWDDDTARSEAWAQELGVPFEADLDKALSRADVDAVVVDTPTTQHKYVMVKAAKAGKHIFTEKALATTMADAREIAEAIQASGVKFCISYPQLTSPLVQLCKQAIDEGLLGNIHYLRFRMAHNGALAGWLPEYWYEVKDAGGGAMMDLGCHPMYVASCLLGKPARITSMFNNNHAPGGVDDNAVSVVEFENKAIAVLETGFISPYNGNCFELLGTEGAIVSVDGQIKMRTKDCADGWFIPDKLPAPLPMAMRMWLDGITKGTDIPFNLERALRLTELLEQAYAADREQRVLPFSK